MIQAFYSNLSLRGKIVIPLVGVFLGVWFAGMFSIGYWLTRKLEREKQEQVQEIASLVSREFEQETRSLRLNARLLAETEDIRQAIQTGKRSTIFKRLLPVKATLELDLLQVVDTEGRVILDLRRQELVETQFSNQTIISQVLSGVYLSSLAIAPEKSQSTIVGASPLKTIEGVVGGLIVGTAVSDDLLIEILQGTSENLVVFHDGKAIASSLPAAYEVSWQAPPVSALPTRVRLGSRTYLSKTVPLSGLEDASLDLVVLKSVAPLQRVQRDGWIVVSSIAMVGAIVSILIGVWLTSLITRRIHHLTEATQQLASGDLTAQIPVAGADEVSQLGRSFNVMVAQLSDRDRTIHELVRSLEERGQELESNLSTIIDNLADGLLAIDPENQIVRFNPTLLAMLALTGSDLEGKSCQEVFGAEVADLNHRSLARPSEVFTAEIELANNRIGQASITAIFRTASMVADDPEPARAAIGSVVLIRDVTDEREIDRMKTDFIATVSHELRTPLTSVMGFADAVKDRLEKKIIPTFPDDDRKMQKTLARMTGNLDIIIAESERLTAIINDVLDIAKMESGKMEWQRQPVAIEDAIDRALAATSSLFTTKGLTSTRQIEPHLPQVLGDRDRIIQVLINLISNAVKFTPEGTVICRAYRRTDKVLVSIIDTGIGIDPQQQEQVFDRFKQVGEVLKDKPKGTGLGLPICKQIVEHHGGTIWVESEPGQGSTFTFSLPIPNQAEAVEKSLIASLVQQLREQAVTPTPAPAEKQPSILVVDDDDAIRELLRQSLEAEGYDIREARDGVEAIQQVKLVKPDLIILDVMMPQINGFEVAAVLKNDPQMADIPIIVLSIVEDRERGFQLGVDRYLTKPINRSKLLGEIGTLLSQGSSSKKVLVVDRDASTLAVLSEVLQAQGYTVIEASDRDECIEKALSLQPDLIIIDSVLSEQQNLVRTLRFEKGLEQVCFILLGEEQS